MLVGGNGAEKEVPRFMATHPVAHIPRDTGKGATPTWRQRIGRALPFVIALTALFSVPGVAFAGGTPPSVNLAVDPASGQVGSQVTVKGSNFTGGDQIQIGYAVGDCSTGITIISDATGSAGSDGSVTISFIWPSSAVGDYVVCAQDTTNGHTYSSSNHFHVASATAPSITVSSPVKSSLPVTVTGSNFQVPGGGTVEILYGPAGSNGCGTSAGTASLKSDGTFTFTFNAPFEASDTQITITAVYPQGACNGAWVLRASKTVTVTGGTATVSPSPKASPSSSPALAITPTATTGTTPVGIVFPPTFPPTPAETVVYCLIGLLLLLLLLLLFLLLSRRSKNNERVTVRQSDRVVVNSGQGGAPTVQSSIYAENPRNQRRTQIAEEVTSIQEEPINPPNSPGGNQFGQPGQQGRFGPAGGGQ
jgi:hypothetical protein